jgi:hypothetical protein
MCKIEKPGETSHQGITGVVEQLFIAQDTVRAGIDQLAVKLKERNEEASTLRLLKDIATAMDGLRKDGKLNWVNNVEVIDPTTNLPKTEKQQNTELMSYLKDFIKHHNELNKDDPTKRIGDNLWDNVADIGDYSKINLTTLSTFDLRVNGISLSNKDTAAAALSSMGTKITEVLALQEREMAYLQKVTAHLNNLTQLPASLIQLFNRMMEGIIQKF